MKFFTGFFSQQCTLQSPNYKPFKEPKNRFLAWRAGTTTLFDVTARQSPYLYTLRSPGIDSDELIPLPGSLKVYKYGPRLHRLAESIPRLLKRLQIWALAFCLFVVKTTLKTQEIPLNGPFQQVSK
jgi:hypothetical protein